MSLHPIHLTPDKEGNLPPSALVPFCSYQGNYNLLGERRPEPDNLTFCSKFEPTVFDGQLCYSLDVAQIGKKASTKAGKSNGLFFLVDPNPYQTISVRRRNERPEEQSFKVHIHTLAQFTAYGPGAYAMSSLKSMTGTKSFKQLADEQKSCQVDNREKCQSLKFLDQVKSSCSCVPWPLFNNHHGEQVVLSQIRFATLFAGASWPLWARYGGLCEESNSEGYKLFGFLYWALC